MKKIKKENEEIAREEISLAQILKKRKKCIPGGKNRKLKSEKRKGEIVPDNGNFSASIIRNLSFPFLMGHFENLLPVSKLPEAFKKH